MKQTIKSLVLVAIAALGIAGCEDVPAPFVEPGGSSGNDTSTENDGSAAHPFEVAELQAKQTGKEVWVHGYIVGSIPTSADGSATYLENMTFTTEGASATNICIAADPAEKNYSNCVPVAITAAIRSQVTLANVPGNLGKEIWLKGTSEKYYGAAGLKNVSKFSLEQPKDEESTPSDLNPKGDGTEANPYNADAALQLAGTLPQSTSSSDKTLSKEVFIYGKIVSIQSIDTDQYGNAEYYISEDGTEKNQLLVYRGYSFNGDKFTSANTIKVGDNIVISGQLVNFKGTLEVNQGSKIIKLNGEGASGSGDNDNPDGTSTNSDAMSIANLPSNITTNNYGSQNTSDAATWLTWIWNGVEFKGAKVCKALANNGAGIQMQGHDTDTGKQGFIFNNTAWDKNISKITVVLKVVTSTKYEPNYSLYAGSAAHPTTERIEPTSSMATEGNFDVYTQVFDLSSANAKFFTIANDKVGALYIDQITVE